MTIIKLKKTPSFIG